MVFTVRSVLSSVSQEGTTFAQLVQEGYLDRPQTIFYSKVNDLFKVTQVQPSTNGVKDEPLREQPEEAPKAFASTKYLGLGYYKERYGYIAPLPLSKKRHEHCTKKDSGDCQWFDLS